MPEGAARSPELPVLFTCSEVAQILGFSERALRKWRAAGNGPPWLRLGGGQIRYPADELDRWLEERTVR